jgi:PAS domain S-box-containing protein
MRTGLEIEEEFHRIADSAPVPIWVTGLDHKRRFTNRAYVEFLAVSYEEAVDLDWRTILHPDDVAHMIADSLVGEASMAPFTLEARYRRHDGVWRWLRSVSQPRYDIGGKHIGFIGVAHDITEAKEAEHALRDSEWHFRTIFEQANDYIFTSDLNQRLTSCNPAVCAALGYTPEEALGKSFADFIDPDQFQQTTVMLQQKLTEGGSTRHTVRVNTRDGRKLIWEINSRLMLDGAGQPAGLHAIARDVTEMKRAEAHQKLLIDELNHRVKNTLAIVQSIAQQSLKRGGDPELARFAFEGRLLALSEAHDLLTRKQWEDAPIRLIVEDAMRPHAEPGRVRIDGPAIEIPPKTAISLALALHELATNAVKYGALSQAGGTVAIDWDKTVEQGIERFTLNWVEAGGPPVTPPEQRGFGTRMIERGLAAELSGKVEINFAETGLQCRVMAPFPRAGT